jgi:hypothetical protein
MLIRKSLLFNLKLIKVLVIAKTSTKSKQQVTVLLEYNSEISGKITTIVTGEYQSLTLIKNVKTCPQNMILMKIPTHHHVV